MIYYVRNAWDSLVRDFFAIRTNLELPATFAVLFLPSKVECRAFGGFETLRVASN